MMKFLVALLLVGAVFSVNSVDQSHAAPVAAAPAAPAAPAVAHSANDGHGHDAHAANDGHGDAAHAAPAAAAHTANDGHGDAAHAAPAAAHAANDGHGDAAHAAPAAAPAAAAHAANDGHGDAAHAAPAAAPAAAAPAAAAPAAAAPAAAAHAANDGHNSHFAPDPNAPELPPVIPPTPVAAESTASTDAKAAAVASVTVESNTPPAPAAPVPAPVAEKLPAVVGSFVPLFCYQNEELKDRIYTINAQELGKGKENWKTCGTVGLVAGEEIEGFAQLLRYVDLNGMKHEYSSKPLIETDELRSEGYEGYVSEQPREGMVALSSYLDKATGERLLSVESSHPASYEQQEVLGYIKPVPTEMVPVPEPTAESTAAAAGNPAHPITAAPEETKFWADHPQDARLQPLFRYWNAALQDHYYTMDYSVLGAGKNGWRYQGIQAYIYPTKVEDTVPLYRYFNLRAGDHFYTTDFYDMGEGKDGYKFSGVTGYVRDAPSKATVPLYRYYNSKIADHFYTTNSMSQAAGTDEWANEGVAAYVYPVPDPAQHENASEYALLVPLYRYWNARYGDHFYTTIWKEVDAGTHGWEYQGVQALVYAKQEPGTVPLYRYWNVQTLDHFYTTNFEALGQGGKDGWKYEGVTAFVDIYRKPGTEPLYRYFNNKLNDHLYVTRWLGRETKGYVYEGIQCYVHRKPLDATDAGRVKAPEGFASLYRYWSASAKDHLYTTNFDELGAGSQGYVLEGVEGFCGKDSESGLTALHRYYNPRVKDTFLTTDFKILKSGGKDGWEYQGVTCYIAATSRPGFVKLNRYYSKINKDHFFTTAFVGQVQASYVFQGITGFIKPYVAAVIGAGNVANTGVVSQEIQANSVELHSYYNAQTKDHFLTTNFDVLGAGKAGWEYRGILARILSTEMANTRKLRQYYSPSRKDHRYTIRHLRGGDWRYEGIVGYIFDEQVPGSTAIMNFENRAAMDNALSLLSAGPRTGGVYDFIETLGYVLPPK